MDGIRVALTGVFRGRWSPRLAVAAVAVFFITPGLPNAAEEKLPEPQFSKPVLIEFEGVITPLLEQFVYRKLDVARRRGADLIILRIDSPGGIVDPSVKVAERLRDLDWAHTVAYVPREAISGAAIAALGCDDIVLHPPAEIGDAGPIFQDELGAVHHAPEKVVSYLRQKVRGLAESTGHPPLLAEAMVDKNLVVYQVRNNKTGETRFVRKDKYEELTRDGQWLGELVAESEEGLFFTATGRRAAELGFADATVEDFDGLKTRYGFRDDPPVLQPSGLDTAIFVLNQPLVTALLFFVGLVALYVEFSAPGIGIGGLTAALCFAVFFWSRFLGGTADWLALVLFVAALGFLAVELFVLPGFGVAGLSGMLLLIVSLVLAMQGFVIPDTRYELSKMTGSLAVIMGSGIATGVAAYFLSSYLGRLPMLHRLTLQPPETVLPKAPPASEGSSMPMGRTTELQAGDVGVADSLLRPAGKARFGNRYVNVVADGDFIAKGQAVKIVEVAGNRVVVVPAKGEA